MSASTFPACAHYKIAAKNRVNLKERLWNEARLSIITM